MHAVLIRCLRKSTNHSKDRRQLPPRLDYLATFHRYTTSFTTASSPTPPPSPSSEALWQRSSLGHYRFPPIALLNFTVSGIKSKVSLKTSLPPKLMNPHEFARHIAVLHFLRNTHTLRSVSSSKCRSHYPGN